tara:strand:- start:19 stop:174 length:156 start_codon:yes stop_codon:yes gene_type:complete
MLSNDDLVALAQDVGVPRAAIEATQANDVAPASRADTLILLITTTEDRRRN